jgi:hypothetical protein
MNAGKAITEDTAVAAISCCQSRLVWHLLLTYPRQIANAGPCAIKHLSVDLVLDLSSQLDCHSNIISGN